MAAVRSAAPTRGAGAAPEPTARICTFRPLCFTAVHHPLQAQAELDRLIQLEYWLKYDFTGCVRKLLPARQQVGGKWHRPGLAGKQQIVCCCSCMHVARPFPFPERGMLSAKHLGLL